MAKLRIGLDVGNQSIGWSVISPEQSEIIASGVFIFPEGVARDNSGGEKSKNQTRREARGTRRRIARTKRRKRILKDALVTLGMFPSDHTQQNTLMEVDPYQLRAKALDEPLEPYELGRVFYHLAQRRGFLSNRKTDAGGDQGTVKQSISQLDDDIKTAGCRTMGEYFHNLNLERDHTAPVTETVRGRHTRRVDPKANDEGDLFSYEQEFELIWNTQSEYHPELLSETHKHGASGPQRFPKVPSPLPEGSSWLEAYGIKGIIFFQRKMYWPKSMIGQCELEPSRKRCARSDRHAQLFRIYQELANLRWQQPHSSEECQLSPLQRETLLKELTTKKELKFNKMRDLLKLGDLAVFNLERGNRAGIKGHETDYILSRKNAIGTLWHELADEAKDAITNLLIHEEREDIVLQTLINKYDIPLDLAANAVMVNLPDGRMSYSRHAIERLNPHLKEGKILMGNDASDSAIHAAGYLRPDEQEIDIGKFLPAPPEITNPIVRQAVNEVKKLVNHLLREFVYSHDHQLESIHIELAREAKLSAQRRKELMFEQRENMKRRNKAKEEMPEHVSRSRNNVNRYLLWMEQDQKCIYSGRNISQTQLYDGSVDVDHILPRWRSLDNSMMNKVVCFRSENEDKRDLTPAEWLEDSDPDKFQQLLTIARKVRLPYPKLKRLTRKNIKLEDFVERNLRDTSYIATCVKNYLKTLDCEILSPHGYMTSELAHQWGLHPLLNEDGSRSKNRSNHKHHAIDAIVLALIDHKTLNELATSRGKDMPAPWENFRRDVANSLSRINVCHKPQRRIRDALHEDTIYGSTQKVAEGFKADTDERPWAKDWIEDEQKVVRRKPVTQITNAKHVDKIRDHSIRKILLNHVTDLGHDISKPFPKGVFEGDNSPSMPSGVPIKKVRMVEKGQTFRRFKGTRHQQAVKPGNNHHIVYREQTGKTGKVKWVTEVTTMWDAAHLARRNLPIVNRSNTEAGRFLFSLSIGEALELENDHGELEIYIVRKINQDGRLFIKRHDDARQAGELDKETSLCMTPGKMQKGNATKVTISRSGLIKSTLG